MTDAQIFRAHKRIRNKGFEWDRLKDINDFVDVNKEIILEYTKGVLPEIKETTGKKAFVKENTIYLPRHYWNQLVLCHEIAHVGHTDEIPIHGMGFIYRELAIIANLMGRWHAEDLKANLVRYGAFN